MTLHAVAFGKFLKKYIFQVYFLLLSLSYPYKNKQTYKHQTKNKKKNPE